MWVSLGLVVLLVALALGDVPASWRVKFDAGELLYAAVTPEAQLNATIGNGFVATSVGSDTVFMAGVYNGYNNTTPSHRARIVGYPSLTFTVAGEVLAGYALDLTEAVFMHRTTLGQSSVVQRSTYAHRARRNLIVVEAALLEGTSSVSLISAVNLGAPSTDVSAPVRTVENDGMVVYSFQTLLSEDPWVPAINISVAHSPIPAAVTLAPGQAQAYLFSFSSSLDAADPTAASLMALRNALSLSVTQLRQEHTDAWKELNVAGRISVVNVTSSNRKLVQTVVSSLYYLLSSVRADWPHSLSPGGLASQGYNGHVFWDTETWMYPTLLLFYPEIAESILQYRSNTLKGSIIKARSYQPPYKGACLAWESARLGVETCPASCIGCGSCTREIHINGDAALALAQYFWLTHDTIWLRNVGFPIARAISEFWASRVTLNNDSSYSILDVVPPDEYADHVADSVYTNVGAAFTLDQTVRWASLLNVSLPAAPLYKNISKRLRVPYDSSLGVHLEFAGYKGQLIKQADVVLLGYPMPMKIDAATRARNVLYYTNRTDSAGPAMTWGVTAVALLEDLTHVDAAQSYFTQSYDLYVHQPFGIWWETTTGGASNFLTGAGGFLQGLPFGFGGVRITERALVFLNVPVLPNSVEALSLNGLSYMGNRLTVIFSAVRLFIASSAEGCSLQASSGGDNAPVGPGGVSFLRNSIPVSVQCVPNPS